MDITVTDRTKRGEADSTDGFSSLPKTPPQAMATTAPTTNAPIKSDMRYLCDKPANVLKVIVFIYILALPA
jgi:hypothetical protein